MKAIRAWIKDGSPWIWFNAGAVAICLVLVFGVLGLIALRGAVYFWPSNVVQTHYQYPATNSPQSSSAQTQTESVETKISPGEIIAGEIEDEETVSAARVRSSGVDVPEGVDFLKRYLLKTGNRDVYGSDFRWVFEEGLSKLETPPSLVVFERREWGNFYGKLKSVKNQDGSVQGGKDVWELFLAKLDSTNELMKKIKIIEKGEIGSINYQMEQLRLKQRSLEINDETTEESTAAITEERQELETEFQVIQQQLHSLLSEAEQYVAVVETVDGRDHEINLSKIVQAYRPNAMTLMDKIQFYFHQLWVFLSQEPREANTEGGVFPAIFGTVLMVLLMTVLVTPFGVIAAVYMREYAKQGLMTRVLRIAVNNLAGVPSIVYGVFGLGFFVYFLGGSIDSLFYPEVAPAPMFGTPGLMWASITLALLTVPVVIVATEEGLARIPKSMREGSLALGATKFETLWKIVLPMSSPAMMTGLILAIARAAGEVAPLMLVGVVKLAPTLPLDGNAPFLHLEQKFMHLGFHIYDVGFQSPNIEAARPLVYATAFLLVVVIATLNLTAITLRNRMREKYRGLEM